jgi:hypothetical protein
MGCDDCSSRLDDGSLYGSRIGRESICCFTRKRAWAAGFFWQHVIVAVGLAGTVCLFILFDPARDSHVLNGSHALSPLSNAKTSLLFLATSRESDTANQVQIPASFASLDDDDDSDESSTPGRQSRQFVSGDLLAAELHPIRIIPFVAHPLLLTPTLSSDPPPRPTS